MRPVDKSNAYRLPLNASKYILVLPIKLHNLSLKSYHDDNFSAASYLS
jgi:hypothetical protein